MRLIAEKGSDLQYGARPLRRAIQRMVEDALSEEILMGNIQLGKTVIVSVDEENECLRFAPAEETIPEMA